MRCFILIACLVALAAIAHGQEERNCKKECRENSECEALAGPCTMCKSRKGSDEMKCVEPRGERPEPCGTDCNSDDDCQIEDEESTCPACQPKRKGEGNACQRGGDCRKPCESDDDCDSEGPCPSCRGKKRSKKGKKCLPQREN